MTMTRNPISTNNGKETPLTHATVTQKDIYARVTDKIMSDLENGNLTWRKPWNADYLASQVTCPLRWNGVPYGGINILILWGTAVEQGYSSPYWMTFKQASELKASVRKGEKGTQIVYADKFVKEEANAKGETVTSQIPFLKLYTVFNAAQIDGLSDGFYKTPKPRDPAVSNPQQRIDQLETFFAQTKAEIYTGREASYLQSTDRIQMPPFESFDRVTGYYAVLAHELTHWTKHPTRLNRDLGRKHYGDEGCAREELVAELGACFLAADLGFEPMPEAHHAAYIQSWLRVLKDDKRFIVSAASQAQKAVEYIHHLQPL